MKMAEKVIVFVISPVVPKVQEYKTRKKNASVSVLLSSNPTLPNKKFRKKIPSVVKENSSKAPSAEKQCNQSLTELKG